MKETVNNLVVFARVSRTLPDKSSNYLSCGKMLFSFWSPHL